MTSRLVALALAGALALTGCVGEQSETDQPLVVATTTIVGDLVDAVGHDAIRLEVLMPTGVDPREFRPSADQAADLCDADLIVTSGLGLETGLVDALAAARAEGVPVLELGDELGPLPATGDADAGPDPYWWLDPNRAAAAVLLIGERLSAESADPVIRLKLAPRAEAAAENLSMLGQQMTNALDRIRPEQRRLFTSQDELRYLAERFDFEIADVIADVSTADPCPGSDGLGGLAGAMLDDEIDGDGIDAIFADSYESARLAEALASELGSEAEVVTLDLCSLGGPGSGAETYCEMMRTTADRIAEALT